MASKKVYDIVINGLKESINSTNELIESLGKLKERIDELKDKTINITTQTTEVSDKKETITSTEVNNSSLREQDELLDKIASTEQKIAEARSEDYQYLIKLKDELKQVKGEQDAAAASAKLMSGAYDTTTLQGMKEQLKDTLRVLNTLDTGSTEFQKLNEQAKELTYTLRELEASRGSFGRSVGDYATAAKGFEKLKVVVGDTVREFDSAKEALRELKNERDTIAMMGGDFEDVDTAVKKLQSSLNDLNASSKAMDSLLDTMESFVAVASTVKGIGALIGADSSKIDETVKKLLALQTALKGIESLNKQIKTGEGIFGFLSTGSKQIDKFTTSLLGTRKALNGVTAAQKTATVASKAFGVALKGIGIGLIISLIATLVSKWDKINDAINKSIPGLQRFGGIMGVIEGAINGVINAMTNMFKTLDRLLHLDFKGAFNVIRQSFADGFQEVADDTVRIQKAADAERLKLEMELFEAQYGEEVKYTAKYKKLLAERNKLLRESYNPNTAEGKKQLKELEIQQANETRQYKEHAKELQKLQRESDQELINLKISNMKEGLNKTITQLEEERKERIYKARETGRNVREIEAEINKEYDRKELEARSEYAKATEQIYADMEDAINRIISEGDSRRLSMLQTQSNVDSAEIEDYFKRVNIPSSARTYGTSVNYVSKEDIKNAEQFNKLLASIEYHVNALNKLDKNTQAEQWEMTYEALEKAKEELDEFIATTKGYDYLTEDSIGSPFSNFLYDTDAIKKDTIAVFEARREALVEGYKELITAQNANEKAMYEQRLIINENAQRDEIAQLDNNREEIVEKLLNWYEVEQTNLKEQHENGLLSEEDYEHSLESIKDDFHRKSETLEEEYYNQLEDIQRQHKDEENSLDKDYWDKLRDNQRKYYDSSLQEARDFQTSISNLMSVNPVYDVFGVFDVSANRKNINEARTQLETLMRAIAEDRDQLNEHFKQGLIDPTFYENTNREFSRMIQTCVDDLSSLRNEARQLAPNLMESLQVYIQAVGQTVSSVLDAVWEAQDAAYEKEKEQIDNDLEVLAEKYKEMEDLAQEHSDKVNGIEDELSTARGDRRQELIDQLNAEKTAQREALNEQKRIEKEQEKLEKRQDELDKEQKKRQKDRDITSALINASMAVSYALANPWPFPALALAAAAAAQGAAQVAAIKSKRYATGGVIEGPSHARGGVKVLGGSVEVEGGEFITRKATTEKNIDLLEFINSKKRKLTIEDFIDFYSGDVKKTVISVSPSRKFAEGGLLPSQMTTSSSEARILDAIDHYADRPIFVSVSEILDVRDEMNNVRALAGLDKR